MKQIYQKKPRHHRNWPNEQLAEYGDTNGKAGWVDNVTIHL